MKNNNGIYDFLSKHNNQGPVSFHMPGHKGSSFYLENGYGDFISNMVDYDITEIPGADNLFQTEGIILSTMEKYEELYNSKHTHLLINGSSAGLIAAMMTVVEEGEKIIMARNCHKSIFNGLSLGKIEPVYAYPDIIEEYGISGQISRREILRCFEENPDAKAVILPSPNYYGITSDIKEIAEEVHRRGKVLIVDQAHGAHLKLFDRCINNNRGRLSAEEQGADVVINSTHKTLASFTQSAIVNIMSDRVDNQVFADKLQLIESTSPSYILLASLDINADIIRENGEELIKSWDDNLKYFYKNAKEIRGLSVMEDPNLDYTKINLDMGSLGIDGLELERLLMRKNIYVELVTGNIVMCMTGIGNKRYDFDRLLEALREISLNTKGELILEKKSINSTINKKLKLVKLPQKKEKVHISKAYGRVCGTSLIPYPPGIPIICTGEVMDKEVLEYVQGLREQGEKVMGIDEDGFVTVGI